jgi:PAS domain S-box-containing protein
MGLQRIEILLILSDQTDRDLIERLVRREGLIYKCEFANLVSVGKTALASETYDAVIMDYMLSDGDAIDFLKVCRPDLPVVVLTEVDDEELPAMALDAGAAGFLIKDPGRKYLKALPVTLNHAIKVKRMETELDVYHDQLIKIVKKRTRLLHQKNDQLNLEIQERIRTEEKLKRTTEQLSVMLDSLPIVPFSCKAEDNFTITYVSSMISEITGYAPEQFTTGARFWVRHLHPRDRKPVLAKLEVQPQPSRFHIEYRFRIADGSFKWFSDIRRIVKLPDGAASHIVGTWQDITEEKALRHESEYRRQQLIQADKLASLGEVVAGVAHEINNPNSFITYNVPLLKETWEIFEPIIADYAAVHPEWEKDDIGIEEFCEDMKDSIQAIKTGSERINMVVANLKDFARIDESDLPVPVQVNEVIEKTLWIVGAQLRKSIATIDINLADNLPDIQGHFQKLEQVVANLVVNAANAIPERERGKLTITTRYIHRISSILIEIEDNGIGMTSEVMERLFDPFFTTRRDAGGTGLGLSVSYGLVQEHKGMIGVQSRSGVGSRFTVFLPIDREVQLNLQPAILCVDDEESVLKALRFYFDELQDISLQVSRTPEAVMTYLENHPEVDIVLSDILMPGINGWALLKKIKNRYPLLPVILYSGDPFAMEHKPEDTPDPDHFLQKPFDIRGLMSIINAFDRLRIREFSSWMMNRSPLLR